MTIRKSAHSLTNAERAEAVFKPKGPAAKPLDEQAMATKAFDDNRERLKAERLARTADKAATKGNSEGV